MGRLLPFWYAAYLCGIAAVVGAAEPGSFRYADGAPAEITIFRYVGGAPGARLSGRASIPVAAHRHEVAVDPIRGTAYAYASFIMGERNPASYVRDQPTACQTITLGQMIEGRFVGVVQFGMVDDDRASTQAMARYTPGVFDGQIEYYGMYARPRTTYDFRLQLNLDQRRMTVWVAGRGDDAWFPLATNVPLVAAASADGANPARALVIDALRVDQLPEAPGVDRVVIQTTPWPEGEALRPHSLAKKDRVVRPDAGFKFQTMRSLWRLADRHVTIARNPNASQGWWLGFPEVVLTGDSSLVCAYCDGAGHGGGGRIWARRSDDLGRTWAGPVEVHPSGVNCPRIQRLRDGSLVVLADLHSSTYPVVLYRSTDGGRVWKQLGTLDPVAAGGHASCVPSRITELEDGSWLVHGTYTPGQAWKVSQGETLEFFRSEDRGKSWKLYSTLAPPPPLSICESSVAPLADGRWLLVARESGGFLPGVRSFSKDQGKSWSPLEEMPFFIQGRTCADLLADGRVMVTFRADSGPAALWAWAGRPDEKLPPVVRGIHFNDRTSTGLKDGELHLDNDGACGQFTKYVFRPPDGPESRIDLTAVVKVASNGGRGATLSVPFVGKLRLFADRIELAHDPTLRVPVAPGEFHTYRIVSSDGKMTLSVDGQQRLSTDKLQRHICALAWSALKLSPYLPAFGNEEADDRQAAFDWVPQQERQRAAAQESLATAPQVVLPHHITPAVTGHSVWRSFELAYDDPKTGARRVAWHADRDGFPDQYQLDRLLEVEATVAGCDQGYSGWARLPDGRIFVVNYSDDTARWNRDASCPPLGVAWIRGTFLLPEDLPPSSQP